MVTYSSPYPGTPHDDQWGATVGPGVVTHKFWFQDGTADGWLADPGDVEFMDRVWAGGTRVMSSTDRVGPGGYALVINETVLEDWWSSPMWGYVMSPKFPVRVGDKVTTHLMVCAKTGATNDDAWLIDTVCFPSYWYDAGVTGIGYEVYQATPGMMTFDYTSTQPYPRLFGSHRVTNNWSGVEHSWIVQPPGVTECAMEWYLFPEEYFRVSNPVRLHGVRILGATITVETPR